MKLKKNLGEVTNVKGPTKIKEPSQFWVISIQDKHGKQVGGLKIVKGKLIFRGNADKAARLFFEALGEEFWSFYLKKSDGQSDNEEH